MSSVLQNFDAIDNVTGKPVEVVLDAIYNLLDNKSYQNSPYNLDWQFAEQHRQVQNRINRILGDGFRGTITYDGKKITAQQAHDLIVANPTWWKRSIDINYRYGFFDEKDGATGTKFYFKVPVFKLEGGWKDVDWMHWDSLDAAMKGIFQTCIGGENWNGKALTPKDDYKAYSYPTPSIANQYGSNLPYFKRCAPANVGCQLFGVNISASTAIIILGAVIATVATGGTAVSLLATLSPQILKVWPNLADKLKDTNQAQDFIADIANIGNGADIDATDKTAVTNYANQILQSGSQLFDKHT